MSRRSPYSRLAVSRWEGKTVALIRAHPLEPDEIVEIVLRAWEDIFTSSIGRKPFRIGKDIFPKPQILGFFLHELIALELGERYPGIWRGENTSGEKDLVFKPDEKFSVEIKTSSHPNQIFGNRSYAQVAKGNKKSKSGYYLAVNFEALKKQNKGNPRMVKIRFGWLDHTDWTGQRAATGQQARLSSNVEKFKLLELYPTKQMSLSSR